MAARKSTKKSVKSKKKSAARKPARKVTTKRKVASKGRKTAAKATTTPKAPVRAASTAAAPAATTRFPAVAILSAVRSGLAKGGKGALKDTRPDAFAAQVLRAAIGRAGVPPAELGDVVLGCAMPEAEQGMNLSRIVAMQAGLPVEVPSMTINRFCSSGLEAVATVADRITAGRYKVAVAGGVESMSLVPMGGHRPSASPWLMQNRPEVYTPMGITAELVATRHGITREMQDEMAVKSHQKAVAAMDAGRFSAEIVPVTARVVDDNGTVREETFATDEGPRRDTSLEGLKKLKPVFDKQGTVTAGNASQVTDGAAAVVLADADYAVSRGWKPRAFLRGYAVVGVAPEVMGIGPVPAIRKLLADARLTVKDIDLFEINEAFAAQAAYCQRELGIPDDKLNVNGGAIALGHPLGCTGARQVATLLSELDRRAARYGVISMCVGGGMGAAALIERAR